MANERYSPMFWLNRWEEYHNKNEFERAIGYAHLALLLAQQVCVTWHDDVPNAGLPTKFIKNAHITCMSAFQFDNKNMQDNEMLLYFEGLKLLALRSLLTSLQRIDCFEDAQSIVQFMLTPENFAIKLSEDERARLNRTLFMDIAQHTNIQQANLHFQTYPVTSLRREPVSLWANPYDIDVNSADGVQHLRYFLSVARKDINRQKWREISDADKAKLKDGKLTADQKREIIQKYPVQILERDENLIFIRDKNNGPFMVSKIKINKNEPICIEKSLLSVTVPAVNKEANLCHNCWRKPEVYKKDPRNNEISEADKKLLKGDSCCALGAETMCGKRCMVAALKTFHHCVKSKVEVDRQKAYFNSTVLAQRDFGHANLLIKRMADIYQKDPTTHPLQYDFIPYISSTIKRRIPWNYKVGIVWPIETLLRCGIDPFINDDWDIQTILILWRKLGPVDFHCFGQDFFERKADEKSTAMVLPAFSAIFPTPEFLRQDCDPNARIILHENQLNRMVLVALRDIKPLEPITVSRIEMNKDERYGYPRRQKEFDLLEMEKCGCNTCILDRRTLNQYSRDTLAKKHGVEEDNELLTKAHKSIRQVELERAVEKEIIARAEKRRKLGWGPEEWIPNKAAVTAIEAKVKDHLDKVEKDEKDRIKDMAERVQKKQEAAEWFRRAGQAQARVLHAKEMEKEKAKK